MRDNKILAVAITTALVSTAALLQSATAGTVVPIGPTLSGTAGTPCAKLPNTPSPAGSKAYPGNVGGHAVFAMESLSGATKVPSGCVAGSSENSAGNTAGTTGCFAAQHILPATAMTAPIRVTFTLDNGVTWGDDLTDGQLVIKDQVGNIIPRQAVPGGLSSNREKNGFKGQNTVSYIVNINSPGVTGLTSFGGTAGAVIELQGFSLSSFGNLTSNGGSVTLTSNIEYGPPGVSTSAIDSGSTTIMSAVRGMTVEFNALPATKGYIEAKEGFLKYSESNTSSNIIQLCSFTVKATTGACDATALAAYTTTGISAGNSLTVLQSPFAGSIANDKTDPTKGLVWIDTGTCGTGTTTGFAAATDIAANTVTADSATWQFTTGNITAGNICIQASGTTQITDFPDPAKATLQVGSNSFAGSCRHIKRNGTVCKLYNIPAMADDPKTAAIEANPSATDEVSVRITNKSATEATVYLRLQDVNGNDLLTGKSVAMSSKVPAYGTYRLTAKELIDMTKDKKSWTDRATLTVSSEVSDGQMEILGLLRNRFGGPLMNLSTGATGNGCD